MAGSLGAGFFHVRSREGMINSFGKTVIFEFTPPSVYNKVIRS